MHFLQAINSDLSALIACNKTGGTIKGDIKTIKPVIRNVHNHLQNDTSYMPEDPNIQQYRCENIKPRILDMFIATQLTEMFPVFMEPLAIGS